LVEHTTTTEREKKRDQPGRDTPASSCGREGLDLGRKQEEKKGPGKAVRPGGLEHLLATFTGEDPK